MYSSTRHAGQRVCMVVACECCGGRPPRCAGWALQTLTMNIAMTEAAETSSHSKQPLTARQIAAVKTAARSAAMARPSWG